MDISEWLDEDCDAKVTFEQVGELGGSVMMFSIEDDMKTNIRVYPDGIRKLKMFLDFIEKNQLIVDSL